MEVVYLASKLTNLAPIIAGPFAKRLTSLLKGLSHLTVTVFVLYVLPYIISVQVNSKGFDHSAVKLATLFFL